MSIQSTPPVSRRSLNVELLVLLGIVLAFNAPLLRQSVIPNHDSFYAFEVFHFFMSALSAHGEIPMWAPYGFLGIPADYFINNFLGPELVGLGAIGLLLRVADLLLLYKLSILLRIAIFVVGTWLLSRELFRNRGAVWFATLSLGLSVYWLNQVFFDLVFVQSVPLTLSFLFRFSRTRRPIWFFVALVSSALGMWGNIEYFGPIYFYLYLIVFLVLFAGRRSDIVPLFKPTPARLALLILAVLLAGLYIHNVIVQFDGIHYTAIAGRDPVTFKASARGFLNYGTVPSLSGVLNEFLLGKGVHSDLMLYVGVLPIGLFFLSLFLRPKRAYFAIFIPFLFFGAIAVGGVFAGFAFHLPFMAWYRHIGYLWALEKIFVVLGAGFALEALLDWLASRSPSGPGALWADLWGLAHRRIGVSLMLLVGSLVLLAPKDFFEGTFHNYATAPREWVVQFLWLRVLILMAGLVAALLVIRSRGAVAARALPFILAACLLLDLGIFRIYRMSTYPVFADLAVLKNAVAPRPWSWTPMRLDYPATEGESILTRLFYDQLGGVRYTMFHNFARLDSFPPLGRMDLMPKGLARLLSARGISSLQDEGSTNILRDPPLRRSLGYLAPKITFHTSPRFAVSDDEIHARLRVDTNFGRSPFIKVADRSRTGGLLDWFQPPERILREVLGFTPNTLRLTVSIPQRCYLVYADSWHPDWKVYVDGRPRAVLAANQAFKAVKMEAGDRLVEFRFEHFKARHLAWLVLMIAGFFAMLGLFAWAAWGRREEAR